MMSNLVIDQIAVSHTVILAPTDAMAITGGTCWPPCLSSANFARVSNMERAADTAAEISEVELANETSLASDGLETPYAVNTPQGKQTD